jgi:CheY-like chemotaxis protein
MLSSPTRTRLLLVEDNPAHAELIRRTLGLATAQVEITHITDGEAAIDYLQRHGPRADSEDMPLPELILLDLRLPKQDGFEVLRTIRADPALAHIPVVILSSSSAEHDIWQAYTLHANSYLVKPFSFSEFVALMTSFNAYWLEWNQFSHP